MPNHCLLFAEDDRLGAQGWVCWVSRMCVASRTLSQSRRRTPLPGRFQSFPRVGDYYFLFLCRNSRPTHCLPIVERARSGNERPLATGAWIIRASLDSMPWSVRVTDRMGQSRQNDAHLEVIRTSVNRGRRSVGAWVQKTARTWARVHGFADPATRTISNNQ
jgi:hypothetical protein